jgi:hypothetical protein
VDDAQPFYNVRRLAGQSDRPEQRATTDPTNGDWFRMAGGDGFYAVRSLDNLVYAESQTGGVVRYDARTGQTKNIRAQARRTIALQLERADLPSKHEVKSVFAGAPSSGAPTAATVGEDQPDLTRHRSRSCRCAARPDSTALGRNDTAGSATSRRSINRRSRRICSPSAPTTVSFKSRATAARRGRRLKFPSVPETTFVSRVIW